MKTESKITFGPIIPAALLILMLLNLEYANSVFYDMVCALVLIPLIVTSGAYVSTRSFRLNSLFSWLGAISYPFYHIHGPILRLFFQATIGRGFLIGFEILLAIGALIITVVLSAALLRFYDEPFRNWLSLKYQ